MKLTPKKFQTGSLWDPKTRSKAARLAKEGYPIGFYNRGVCGIWGNGQSLAFVGRVQKAKGEKRQGKPLAFSVSTRRLTSFLDRENIHPELHKLFADAQETADRFGSLCFFRFPITQDATSHLPQTMVSLSDEGIPIAQNWDPWGHDPVWDLINEFHQLGINYPAVTSMNISGQTEIVDQAEALDFCRRRGIPIFLSDPRDNGEIVGTYPIINLNKEGATLIRHGNLPVEILSQIMEVDIKTKGAIAHKHQPHQYPPDLIKGLSPKEARTKILAYIDEYGRHI